MQKLKGEYQSPAQNKSTPAVCITASIFKAIPNLKRTNNRVIVN